MPSGSSSRHGSSAHGDHRRTAAYTGSRLTRVLEDEPEVNNRGLARYETDHVPKATAPPGRSELTRVKSAVKDTHKPSSRALEPTRAASKHGGRANSQTMTRATSSHAGHDSQALTRAASRHAGHESRGDESRRHESRRHETRVDEIRRYESRGDEIRRHESRGHESRGQETRGVTRGLEFARPAGPRNYGPTSLTVHKEVTRAPRKTRQVIESSKCLFIDSVKDKFGRGKNDPRPLDEILEDKYVEGIPASEFVRLQFRIPSHDRRPLEFILHEIECRVEKWDAHLNGNDPDYPDRPRLRNLKGSDSYSDDDSDHDDDFAEFPEPQRALGRSIRTIMPRDTGRDKGKGKGNGRSKSRIIRLLKALTT